jgi:cyclophilin family peptidyl-prolyl cis-trans isomerase
MSGVRLAFGMRHRWIVKLVSLVFLVVVGVHANAPMVKAEDKQAAGRSESMVVMETSEGTIKIELWADKAPMTVKNFLKYVDDGFYEGTVFHRVIRDFMIQGGGLTADLKTKPNRDPVKNEASPELKNERGTVAMARTNMINSATSQFFINVVDNDFLNQKNKTPMGFGYCVFGKVVEGMEVVDKIRAVPTSTQGQFENVPVNPVVIKSIKRVEQP